MGLLPIGQRRVVCRVAAGSRFDFRGQALRLSRRAQQLEAGESPQLVAIAEEAVGHREEACVGECAQSLQRMVTKVTRLAVEQIDEPIDLIGLRRE